METQIVLVSRSGSHSIPILHDLIERAGVVVVPFDEPRAETAFDAFRRYGKGQGHTAQLNIIDCAAYALAKRLEHIPNSDPPRVRIISDNPLYKPYEGSGEEVNIIDRIRWFAREM